MNESGAVKAAEDVRELLMQNALKICILLIRSDYVWGSSEGVVVSCGRGGGFFRGGAAVSRQM